MDNCMPKWNNLDEMDKLLEKQSTKTELWRIENLKEPILARRLNTHQKLLKKECILPQFKKESHQKLLAKKGPGPDNLTGRILQIFKRINTNPSQTL